MPELKCSRGERVMDRQLDRVLLKVAVGKTNAEIARDLGIKEQTVKNYINDLLRKHDVGNRTELAMLAVVGYIPSEEDVRERILGKSRSE